MRQQATNMKIQDKYKAVCYILDILGNPSHPEWHEYATNFTIEQVLWLKEYRDVCEDHGIKLITREVN